MPKLLTRLRIDEVSAVDRGAGEGVKIMLMKRDDDEPYWKREFSEGERREAASSGAAQSDGSFPIKNASDLKNAMRAIGRSKNPAKTKAHIRARARVLGLTSMLSDAFKREDRPMSKFTEFFLGKRDNKTSDVIAKATEALAQTMKAIDDDDDADEDEKNKAKADSFKQFQDHLESNITADPAPDKGDDTMLKALAKALGLKEDAGEEDITKAIAARDQEIAILKAGLTDEEKAFHDKLAEGEREKFRGLTKDARKAQMHKSDDLPEYVRKQLEEAADMKNRLEKMEEAAELQKFEKIAVEHKYPTTAATKLMKLSKADPDAFKEMIESHKAAWIAAEKGGTFRELGASGGNGAGATAYEELQAKAAELRKTHPEMSEAQAFAKVFTDPANKDLAKRERMESSPAPVNPPGTMR